MTITCIKQLAEFDGDDDKNKLYGNIIDNLYIILHARRL